MASSRKVAPVQGSEGEVARILLQQLESIASQLGVVIAAAKEVQAGDKPRRQPGKPARYPNLVGKACKPPGRYPNLIGKACKPPDPPKRRTGSKPPPTNLIGAGCSPQPGPTRKRM